MVHILLLILKITGIVLLTLLLLVFVLLLCVLFVPVRYRGEFQKKQTGMEGLLIRGRIAWLAGIFFFSFEWKEKKIKNSFRIFGVKAFESSKKEKRKGKSDGGREQTKERAVAGSISETEENEETKNVSGHEELLKKLERAVEEECSEIPEEKSKENGQKPEKLRERQEQQMYAAEKSQNISEMQGDVAKHQMTELLWEKAVRLLRTGIRKILDGLKFLVWLIRVILTFPVRLYQWSSQCRAKAGQVFGRIAEWKKFLLSEMFRQSVKAVSLELWKLIKAIGPKKLQGEITFGFEDPSNTGQALALMGFLYPVLPKKLKVTPVFEQSVLLADVRFSGRIYGITLVGALWRLYRNRNIRSIYRKFQHKEA